jgi:hypothetical protein
MPFLSILHRAESEREIAVEMAGLQRVSPAGIVALVAQVTRWQKEERIVTFKSLERCQIKEYLQRMDVLGACGMTLAETFQRRAESGRFVPVKRIGPDVERLGYEMALCVAPGGEDYEHPEAGIYDLVWYVLTETANNVLQHSRGVGYACAQVGSAEGLVRIAIADNGKGVRQSFVEAGLPWSLEIDDAGAIQKALEPRVSSKGSPTNEGVGLTLTMELARLAKAWLLITSGRGFVVFKPDGRRESGLLPEEGEFRGTLLAMTFSEQNVKDFAQMLHEAKQEAGLLQRPRVQGRFEP